MFDNPGNKIKGCAKVFATIGICASIIWGISLINNDFNNVEKTMSLIGIGIIVVGTLASWFFSLLLYGFGELVENSAPAWKSFQTEHSGKCESDSAKFE